MKVPMSDKVRQLQGNPIGAQKLRDFIATAKINEAKKITVNDKHGHVQIYTVKLVPAKG